MEISFYVNGKKNKEMHSSRMRTTHSLPYRGISVQGRLLSVQEGLLGAGSPGGLCLGGLCQGDPSPL